MTAIKIHETTVFKPFLQAVNKVTLSFKEEDRSETQMILKMEKAEEFLKVIQGAQGK